ncbi:MAG TPA: universal stress protein [Acidothermaceae bacterium]
MSSGGPQDFDTPELSAERKARIVVGVDGSAGSKAALAWAAGQARLLGCPLEAVITWDPVATPWTPYPLDLVNDMRIEHDKVLNETIDEVLGADRGVDVRARVIEGSPGRVLVKVAETASLLVVGRHGRHEWTGRLGSVSTYCVHHAACPVVVVHH